MSRRVTPEGSLLKTVGDLLTAERVWWCRMNTGSIVVGEGKSRRCFTSGRKGMADLLALVDSRASGRDGYGSLCDERHIVPLWIELKSAVGIQSAHQREFQREVEAEGHTYLLVRDAREVAKWLKENR